MSRQLSDLEAGKNVEYNVQTMDANLYVMNFYTDMRLSLVGA